MLAKEKQGLKQHSSSSEKGTASVPFLELSYTLPESRYGNHDSEESSEDEESKDEWISDNNFHSM